MITAITYKTQINKSYEPNRTIGDYSSRDFQDFQNFLTTEKIIYGYYQLFIDKIMNCKGTDTTFEVMIQEVSNESNIDFSQLVLCYGEGKKKRYRLMDMIIHEEI